MRRLDPIHLLTFIFMLKKRLFKHQSLERERVEKVLFQKLIPPLETYKRFSPHTAQENLKLCLWIEFEIFN